MDKNNTHPFVTQLQTKKRESTGIYMLKNALLNNLKVIAIEDKFGQLGVWALVRIYLMLADITDGGMTAPDMEMVARRVGIIEAPELVKEMIGRGLVDDVGGGMYHSPDIETDQERVSSKRDAWRHRQQNHRSKGKTSINTDTDTDVTRDTAVTLNKEDRSAVFSGGPGGITPNISRALEVSTIHSLEKSPEPLKVASTAPVIASPLGEELPPGCVRLDSQGNPVRADGKTPVDLNDLVFLLPADMDRLIDQYGEYRVGEVIKNLSNWAASNPEKWANAKNHERNLEKWLEREFN